MFPEKNQAFRFAKILKSVSLVSKMFHQNVKRFVKVDSSKNF